MNKLRIFYIIINILIILGLVFVIFTNRQEYKITQPEVYTLTGSTFDLDVLVIAAEDTAWCRRYIEHNLGIQLNNEHFNARGFTLPTKQGETIVIWFPNFEDVGIINHEMLHATISIMQWANVPLTEETEEVYCYQLQYLTNELKKKRGTF